MTQERSKLTKHRKLEKSFEDLLTGLSDESDDDIDDLVDFDNLPEMCSEDTLIAITKSNKPYTSAGTMDDSLKLSDFVEEKKDYKSEQSEKQEETTKHSNLFDEDDHFVSEQSKDQDENINNDKLIDLDVGMAIETGKIENNDIFEVDNQNENEKLIDFESRETEDNNFRDFNDEKIDYENSSESNDVEDDNDRYEGNFTVEDDEKKDNGVEMMVTDESGNTVDMDQDVQELPEDDLQRKDSIDLDAIVQDNAHLDVDIGIQKTQLRKRGSLAKRRKPSRNSIHSMGGANEDSHFTDSTEIKPEMQNGHSDESDVFSRQSSTNDGEVTSPPAKKPLPGMVALPGMMGMPVPGQRKKTRGSTPSDSDLTPEDQPQKDFKSIGVKLPIPSRGSSGSDDQTDIRSPVLRKTSDREVEKPVIQNAQQFEKPKLKAVSHSQRDRKESTEDKDSGVFDMPTLKQVEKSPRKSQSSANDSEDSDKHLFQAPKLRRVENAPTESLRFVHGKTGELDDDDENLPKSRISDESRHVFNTPKLKKVDNPPTQTLKLLHGRSDETSESETKLSLGHHNEESSTDDLDVGMYFEKPQLRNVPKVTETLRRIDQEKTHNFEVPSLKNVPKTELELKSPSSTDSDKKFNVPQLKSVQREKANDSDEKGEGVFQIPTLRSTPLPKRREPPKSPETKTFDVPVLRRTPRVKQESDHIETEKPPTGVFEKPKLKSAKSLQQDMDDIDSKESHLKHRFDRPSLRSTPSKTESSVQKSDVKKTESEKPSWLQETKLRPSHSSSFEKSSGNQEEQKPSWLSDSKEKDSTKENKNTNSHDYIDSTPRKSSIPLQENKGNQDSGINGHQTPSRTRLLSSGSDKDGEDLKGKKGTGRDQYVPSWLKTADIRGKSPSTPNLAFVTPSKDTSEVPQWKRELAEKRKGRKDSDAGLSPRRQESTGEKELPPWKVEMGQKKMRQTPLKTQETKKSTEPEWKKAADEKRQRLRTSGLLSSIKTTK